MSNFFPSLSFIGYICGDKCLSSGEQCSCGFHSFGRQSGLYCCISKHETCQRNPFSKKVVCPTGQVLKFNEICHGQCPVSTESVMALASNCSRASNDHCPKGSSFSKICEFPADVSPTFSDSYCWNGRICEKSIKDDPHSHVIQCYNYEG